MCSIFIDHFYLGLVHDVPFFFIAHSCIGGGHMASRVVRLILYSLVLKAQSNANCIFLDGGYPNGM